MKVEKIKECNDILTELESKKFPVSMGLILLSNMNKLSPVMESIMEKERSIIEQYADKDDEGQVALDEQNRFRVSKVNVPAFNAAMDELKNTDIEIIFDKIPVETINRCDETGFDTPSIKELKIIKDYMT